MNAWALLVVSADKQSDTIEHQDASLTEISTANRWEIERKFRGVSTGKDGPRKIVRKMLAEMKALPAESRPAWLLMTRLDRVGREAIECQIVLSEILKLGVRVWTREGGEERGDKAMERFVSAAKFFVAEQENEVRRDKMLAVHRRRRDLGLPAGHKRPYGLTAGPDGHDVPVEGAAEIVASIFAMRADALGYEAICNRIKDTAPPHRLRNGDTIEVRWTPRRIREMLQNRSYIGPIIDEVAFHRAHVVAERVGRSWPARKLPWPLSGAVRCYCGYAVHGRASGRVGDRRYYVCAARWNHGGKLRFVRAEKLEERFVALLADLGQHPERIETYRAAATNLPSAKLLDRALAENRSAIAELNQQRERVWEMNAAGTVRDEDVQERLDTLARLRDEKITRSSEIEMQRALAIAATRRTADTTALISKAVALYGEATDDERRALARAIALDLGGLCIEQDGALGVRTPVSSGKLERHQIRM